jgi:hypothetical protein
MTPRGVRNFNPGNVRLNPGIPWKGMAAVQSDPDFITFESAEYGIRAIVRILRSYSRLGINTVDGIINRYAPANENNSLAYVIDVCSQLKVGPHDPISIEAHMPELVKAIIRHENGTCPYDDIQINTGIGIA